MNLSTELHEGALIVRVGDARVDAAVAIRFKDEMRDLVANGPATVIPARGRVDFLDSSGLGAVVSVMKSLAPDRRLELASLTPNVERVFRLTRMDRVFTIHSASPADHQGPLG